MEVQPGEGANRPGVVVQVGEVALRRLNGDVKHQPFLWCLVVFGVQRGSSERGEDKLVHLQYEGGHKSGLGWLVLHRPMDQNRQPYCLRLGVGQEGQKREGKRRESERVVLLLSHIFVPISVNLHIFWDTL